MIRQDAKARTATAVHMADEHFELAGPSQSAPSRGLVELLAAWNGPKADLRAMGAAILDERRTLLSACAQVCSKAASEVGQEYTLQTRSSGYEGLSYTSVRRIFGELLGSLPERVKSMWMDVHKVESAEQASLYKVFTWSFNRMKQKESDDAGGRIGIKMRGEIDGQALPYPVHTHIDVPYCISAMGFAPSSLATALAACHDAFEEGNSVKLELEAPDLSKIDLLQLLQRFPEGRLGRCLAIGIPALTEAEYVEISMGVEESEILDYESFARSRVRGEVRRFEDHAAGMTKIHLQDPLVFGGLACQIAESVKQLCQPAGLPALRQLDPYHSAALAAAIVKVELGDRMSDIATMDRQLAYYPEDPDFAKYKIMAYASRMLNMSEKLATAVSFLPEPDQAVFERALDVFRGVLAARLESINTRLEAAGAVAIAPEEFAHFHTEIFSPIQAKADAVMRPLLREKIRGFMEPLIGSPGEGGK